MKYALNFNSKKALHLNQLILITISLFLTTSLSAQTLNIKIEGIRNSKGVIQLGFFKSEKDYKDDKSFFKYIDKKTMRNGTINVSYTDIKPGLYAVALLDDENCDKKMNYSFFIPSEGFGFSDYISTGLSKPSFNKFCFNFKERDKTILIKIRYI